jgi:hypothetical protein
MKTKLLSLAGILAILNAKAIEIGPTGSGVELSGFVDLAATDGGGAGGSGNTGTVVGQVELNLDFTSGPWSSSVDFDFYDAQSIDFDGDGNIDPEDSVGYLEEATVTYDFGNGFSITGGKMLSYLGFEAYDPTNMYQFSYAYDVDTEGGQDIYDAYDVGVSVDYGTDAFSIGLWTSLEEDAGFEYALAYTGIENLTAKAIWSDFSAVAVGSGSYQKSTYWISYQLDKLLLAAEVAEKDSDDGTAGNDVEGTLIMANYAVTDSAALTLRYSEQEISGPTSATKTYDGSKFTISPSYVFNDNVAGLIEYSSYDKDSGTTAEPEELFAVELIYTF